MPADIGPKIGIDGEREFRSELSNINQTLKTLKSEMKAVTSAFDAGDRSEKALSAQSEQLTRQIDAQEKKMSLLSKAIDEATEKGNGNTNATLKLKQQYAEAQAATNELRRKMDNLGDETQETGQQFSESGTKAVTFGDLLQANVLSSAIMSGFRALTRVIRKVGSAFADAIKSGAQFGDDILTMAAQTGLSTDELQEYKYMSGLVDVELETITGSMARLTRNMNTARSGTGAAADAFATLGINITNTDGTLRSNKDVFAEAIEVMGRMSNETERDAAAMAIFGRSAQDLNPLIVAGGDAVNKFAQEAHDMGYVLDNDTLQSLSGVNDSMDRLQNLSDSVKNQLATALAPVIQDLANDLQEWVASVDWDEVRQKVADAVVSIKEFFVAVKDNGPEILRIVAGIGAAFATWKVTTVISGLAGSLGLATAAAGPLALGLGAIVLRYYDMITADTEYGEAARTGLKITGEAFQSRFTQIRAGASQTGSWLSTQFNNSSTQIRAGWSRITSFFSNLWERIKGVFSGVGSWFESVGSNIVSGIWSGISNGYTWITNKISGWVSDVVSFIKRVFGIRSPSRVMRDEIGINLARGVAVGFEDEMARAAQTMTAAIPTPAAAFGDVMTGAVNGLGTMLTTQPQGGSAELVININGVTLARQTLNDFISVARQRGMVVTV